MVFVDHLRVLAQVHDFHLLGAGLDRVLPAVFDFRRARLAAFGGNNQYPVGGTRAVNGCSGRPLQYLDVFDISGVEAGQGVGGTLLAERYGLPGHLHAVDHVERFVGAVDRVDAPDVDGNATTGLPRVLGDVDAGRTPLDGLFDGCVDRAA